MHGTNGVGIAWTGRAHLHDTTVGEQDVGFPMVRVRDHRRTPTLSSTAIPHGNPARQSRDHTIGRPLTSALTLPCPGLRLPTSVDGRGVRRYWGPTSVHRRGVRRDRGPTSGVWRAARPTPEMARSGTAGGSVAFRWPPSVHPRMPTVDLAVPGAGVELPWPGRRTRRAHPRERRALLLRCRRGARDRNVGNPLGSYSATGSSGESRTTIEGDTYASMSTI